MPNLTCGGVSVHYSDTGAGESVVLLHAMGASGAQWKRLAGYLPDHYRLVAVDHYGHGQTGAWPGPPESVTHDAEAEPVRAIIDVLGGAIHLVGHSYGGGVALRLAISGAVSLRSLTLLEPTAMSLLRLAGEQALFEQIRDMATGFVADVAEGREDEAWAGIVDGNAAPGTWDALPEEAKAGMRAMTHTAVGTCYGNLSQRTTPEEIATIDVPALVVCGERTPAFHRRMAEIVSERLPTGALARIPGAGHLAPLTHPEPVAQLIAGHLAAC